MQKAWILVMVGGAVAAASVLGACGDSSGSGGSGGTDPDTTSSKSTSDGSTSASTSATMSTSTSATGTSTSSGPIMCSEEATNIVGDCSLLDQDCGPGMTCEVFLVSQNPDVLGTMCATPGLVGLGQPCMPGDCQEGMICVNTCTYVCCPQNAMMGGNEPCGIGACDLDVEFNMTDFHAHVCTFNEVCQFFNPDSCPPNKDCHFSQTGLATCSVPSPGNFMDGDVCDGFGNDCPDSAICIDPDPSDMDPTEVCRYFCEPGSAQPAGLGGCPAGQMCDEGVYDFGFPDIGFCHP